MKHSDLTNTVMRLMLSKNEALLKQFEVATMIEESDDVGYFVDFSFPDKNPTPSADTGFLEVVGKNKDGIVVVGFVLFTKGGILDYLEGYIFGNQKWPESDKDILLELD